jgi:predicted PP-loop superfamily ATPase
MVYFCERCNQLTKHKLKYRGHHCGKCNSIAHDTVVKCSIPERYKNIKADDDEPVSNS